jgi:hypothetical protein
MPQVRWNRNLALQIVDLPYLRERILQNNFAGEFIPGLFVHAGADERKIARDGAATSIQRGKRVHVWQ